MNRHASKYAILGSVLLFVGAPLEALTLEEVYMKSSQYSSELKNRHIAIEQAKLAKNILELPFSPSVELSGRSQAFGKLGKGKSAIGNQASISVQQPLHWGDHYTHKTELGTVQIETALWDVALAKQELYQVAIELFFEALGRQEEVIQYEEQLATIRKKLRVLEGRTAIGRSQATDLLTVRTQEARIEASLFAAKANLDQSHYSLAALMGVSMTTQVLSPPPEISSLPSNWRERVHNHPLLRRQQELCRQSQLSAQVRDDASDPKLALNASYQMAAQPEDSHLWNIGLEARWLLYDRKTNRLEVESELMTHQKQLNTLADLKLQLLTQYDNLAHQWQDALTEVNKLEKAALLARQNYQLFQKEYDAGLVSNLDSLRALDDLLATRRSLGNRKIHSQALIHQLKALVGDLP